jgi:hypothetical protein
MIETPRIVHIKFRTSERRVCTMKKTGKQHEKNTEERQEHLQHPDRFSNRQNEQPLPQPKEYDEIEY